MFQGFEKHIEEDGIKHWRNDMGKENVSTHRKTCLLPPPPPQISQSLARIESEPTW